MKRNDRRNPRYAYELTAEETTNIIETTKIIRKLLECQPMVEDGCIMFDDDQGRIYEDECNDGVDFLNQIIECRGKKFLLKLARLRTRVRAKFFSEKY